MTIPFWCFTPLIHLPALNDREPMNGFKNLKRVDGDGRIPRMSTRDVILPMKEQNNLFREKYPTIIFFFVESGATFDTGGNAESEQNPQQLLTFVCLP
jgi:hypothetical protein